MFNYCATRTIASCVDLEIVLVLVILMVFEEVLVGHDVEIARACLRCECNPRPNSKWKSKVDTILDDNTAQHYLWKI